MDWKHAILHRRSCRTFEKRGLSIEDCQRIEQLLSQSGQWLTPFAGAKVRAKWLGAASSLSADTQVSSIDFKQFGTYGFIKNCPGFIALAVEKGTGDLENLGFVGEKLVLQLTAMGFASCWLGGSFSKASFVQAMECRPGEFVPAVLAVGHAAKELSIVDKVVRWSAKSTTRLAIEQLLLAPNPVRSFTPLWADDLIRAIQLAPSASNKQPWRMSLSDSYIHFYRAESPTYQHILKLGGLANLQRLDLGIALAHSFLLAEQVGLAPQIELEAASRINPSPFPYVFSLKITTYPQASVK